MRRRRIFAAVEFVSVHSVFRMSRKLLKGNLSAMLSSDSPMHNGYAPVRFLAHECQWRSYEISNHHCRIDCCVLNWQRLRGWRPQLPLFWVQTVPIERASVQRLALRQSARHRKWTVATRQELRVPRGTSEPPYMSERMTSLYVRTKAGNGTSRCRPSTPACLLRRIACNLRLSGRDQHRRTNGSSITDDRY